MGAPTETILRARYLFPVEADPVEDGWVAIVDGRIARVGRGVPDRPFVDKGNVAIVPGFVNAHTHLELSPLPGDDSRDPETAPPEDQIEWLRRMMRWRMASGPEDLARAAARNVRDAVRYGTTALADITTRGSSWEAVASSGLRGVVYTEILGLKRSRGLETSEAAFAWLARVRPEIAERDARLRAGLSPHAPYSTSGWLYQRAAAAHVPLSTHLAEFPEELELLETQTGPLRDFLEEIRAWDDGWRPLGDRPADYVRKGELKQADWLIAHGNHLEPEDYWQLRPYAAPEGQRVAVVYCPRTHARFGHRPHPFAAMIKEGVVVCLGTDGRSTAPSLSILDEMRFLHRRVPDTKGGLILAMGTILGAWALRLDQVCGSLAPGKVADLAIVALPDREAADPHDLLFAPESEVVETWIDGELVDLSSLEEV